MCNTEKVSYHGQTQSVVCNKFVQDHKTSYNWNVHTGMDISNKCVKNYIMTIHHVEFLQLAHLSPHRYVWSFITHWKNKKKLYTQKKKTEKEKHFIWENWYMLFMHRLINAILILK